MTVDVAADLHRLDEASSLVGVLQWVVDCSRGYFPAAELFIVKGSTLRSWRERDGEPPSRTDRAFPVTVGGRVVAVLFANPSDASARAAIDILTSYASRTLESMTLHKALGLVSPRAEKLGSGVI